MDKFIFWFSFFMIFYAYFGYLFCLIIFLVIIKIRKKISLKKLNKADEKISEKEPNVSFIIAAYNEEKRIKEKINNTLSIEYPNDKIEIIVASDCSDDNTDEIVKSFAGKNIKLVRANKRKGKENAQMLAVQNARGDIFVFSDVATILKPNALKQIISNFKDPTIGCVSSEDRFIDENGKGSGEGLYVKYEMFLRLLESRVNTIVGLSGSFFAARREVCCHWAPDLQSDFNTLLNAVKLGMKGISDPYSIGYYKDIQDEKKEFQRKVRTVHRGITVLKNNIYLINPKHYGLFSWQLFSHKICRWLVPFFLLSFFILNFFLLNNGIMYWILIIFQIGFYSSALIYFLQLKIGKAKQKKVKEEKKQKYRLNNLQKNVMAIYKKISRVAFYFFLVNLSIIFAWAKLIKGEKTTFWQPTQR